MKNKQIIDYWLRSTWQRMSKMYNEQASQHGSSMVHSFALLSLNPKKGTPSTQLGPLMGIEATSLSRTLNHLEDLNYIKRVKNPEDGRGVLVYLTEEGIKMREKSKEYVYSFNDDVRELLGENAWNSLLDSLEKISEFIEKAPVDAATIK